MMATNVGLKASDRCWPVAAPQHTSGRQNLFRSRLISIKAEGAPRPSIRLPSSSLRVSDSRRHRRRWRCSAADTDTGASNPDEEGYMVPMVFTTAQGFQLAELVFDSNEVYFNGAIDTYMKELEAEQERETAMWEAIVTDESTEEWERDPELIRRMKAVREVERGGVLQEMLYLICVRKLLHQGSRFVSDLQQLQPGGPALPAGMLQPQALASGSLLSPCTADAINAYLASTLGEDMQTAASETPLNIDRVQAARLYGGIVEFGYFARSLEQRCQAEGVPLGTTSDAMIEHAGTLPDEDLKGMCAVQSADAWYAAVRHIGCLFELKPNSDPFDSLGLPYPALSATISNIRLEPGANVWEHYSPPGAAANLAAKARDKASRGWQIDPLELEGALPEADLVSCQLGLFQSLMCEAAVFGALLRDAEDQVQAGGYKLGSYEQRRHHSQQPAA